MNKRIQKSILLSSVFGLGSVLSCADDLTEKVVDQLQKEEVKVQGCVLVDESVVDTRYSSLCDENFDKNALDGRSCYNNECAIHANGCPEGYEEGEVSPEMSSEECQYFNPIEL